MVLLAGGSLTALIPNPPTLGDFGTFIPNLSIPDVFDLIQGDLAFQNPLASPITDCLEQLASILDFDGLGGAFPTSGSDFDSITSMVNVLGTTGIGGTPGLLSHTNGLVGSMPTLMSNGNSILRGSVAMNASGLASVPSNPCELLDSIMGSVLGAANDAFNDIAGLIGPIVGEIANGLAAILGAAALAAGAIVLAVAALAAIVANEIANLAGFLGDIQKFAFANAIPNLASDPCLQAVFNAVGTDDLLGSLSTNVPDFNEF